MADENVKALSAAELRQLANDAEAREAPPVAPQEVVGLRAQPVMISAADLRDLLSLKEQLDDVKRQLADANMLKLAAVPHGEAICGCKACSEPIIHPGEPGYKEVKGKDGQLLPYMAAGTHAA